MDKINIELNEVELAEIWSALKQRSNSNYNTPLTEQLIEQFDKHLTKNPETQLLDLIQTAIDNSDVGTSTPIMIDPNSFNKCVGVMVDTNEGSRLGYTITLNVINQNKDD